MRLLFYAINSKGELVMNQGRARYTINDVNANRYYQMPKFLFEGEFRGLSNNGRVLYSLLKDRHELSLKNGWINEKGEVYLLYTREDLKEMLGCSEPTARKAIRELIEFGLIEDERMGFNRPNRIYLTVVALGNTGEKKAFAPEGKDFTVQREKSFHSGVKESFGLEGKNFTPNETYINITDFNITDSINHSLVNQEEATGDAEAVEASLRLLKNKSMENISNNHDDRVAKVFCSILEQAQLEYCPDPRAAEQALRLLYFSDKPMIINNISIPASQLRRDLHRITIQDINYAFEDFFREAAKQEIKNPIAYLSRCIYNALWDSRLRESATMKYHGLEPMTSGVELDRYYAGVEDELKEREKYFREVEKYYSDSKLT